MNIALLFPILICAAVLVGLALTLRNLAHAESALPVTSEWIGELSTDRYRPMARMLDGRDIEFLRTQPGYTSQMESRLRKQRCQIFRGFLRCLEMDFSRVATALKIVMAQSGQDRPDLAAVLIQQQIRFGLSMKVVQCRLLLFQFGVGRVDVSSLLQVFDLMRVELGGMVPAGVEACA